MPSKPALTVLLMGSSIPCITGFASMGGVTSSSSFLLPRQLHIATDQRTSVATLLNAHHVPSSSMSDRHDKKRRRDETTKQQEVRWPRRIWSKVIRKNGRDEKHKGLRMVIDQETEQILEATTLDATNNGFILENFEKFDPSGLFQDMKVSTTATSGLDSEFFEVSITKNDFDSAIEASDAPSITAPANLRRFLTMPRLMTIWLESILSGVIHKITKDVPESLEVEVSPRGRVLTRLLCGQLSTDAKISFGRLVFGDFQLSSGAVKAKRFTLNLLGFTPEVIRRSASRFPKQFDLHFDNLEFSREDLLNSSGIRNGLRTLLVRILRIVETEASSVKVTDIDIMNGKISISGEAKTLFGSAPIPFEVRTGVSPRSRGHVLDFMGLEVSVNPDSGIFVPIVPTIDLDCGHNTRFHNIEIDSKNKAIHLTASVTITPEHTIRVNNYNQTHHSFASKFSCDVGRWLTRACRFHQ